MASLIGRSLVLLVTLFSFLQGTHAQYGADIKGFAPKKLPPIIKGLEEYLLCDVCKETASYLFFTFENMRNNGIRDLKYNKDDRQIDSNIFHKVTEQDLMELTERVCFSTDEHGDWLTRYNIKQGDDGFLKLVNMKRYGERSRVTQTIETMCTEVMADWDTTLAEQMWLQPEMPRSKLTRKLCSEMTDACAVPSPKYPGKFNATGDIPPWTAQVQVEVEKKNWYRVLGAVDPKGVAGMGLNTYDDNEVKAEKYGYNEDVMADDDDDNDIDYENMDEERKEYFKFQKAKRNPELLQQTIYESMMTKGYTKAQVTKELKRRGKSMLPEEYWDVFDFELGNEALPEGQAEYQQLNEALEHGQIRLNEETGIPEINPDFEGGFNPLTPDKLQALYSKAKKGIKAESERQEEEKLRGEKKAAKRAKRKEKKDKKKLKKKKKLDDELRRHMSRRMLRA